jgi:acyl carrier protein
MSIAEEIRAFVCEAFYVRDALADDASLTGTGTVDSTGMLEVISFLENRFGIEIANRELAPENLDTLGGLTRFVEAKLAASQSAAGTTVRPEA